VNELLYEGLMHNKQGFISILKAYCYGNLCDFLVVVICLTQFIFRDLSKYGYIWKIEKVSFINGKVFYLKDSPPLTCKRHDIQKLNYLFLISLIVHFLLKWKSFSYFYALLRINHEYLYFPCEIACCKSLFKHEQPLAYFHLVLYTVCLLQGKVSQMYSHAENKQERGVTQKYMYRVKEKGIFKSIQELEPMLKAIFAHLQKR
jgi:hypothetical protein